MNSSEILDCEASFDQLVGQGGDERLDILPSGSNKYHVNPVDFQNTFNRGSCTCSPFSKDGFGAAQELYNRLNAVEFDRALEQHARRIKKLINYEARDRFHVFFAPSGSDLCYFQLLFAKLINPDQDIYNIVTCPEELGSGSVAALQGKYYSNRNQFGHPTNKGERLNDTIKVECEMLPARDVNGEIFNHSAKIMEIVQRNYRNYMINGNLVIGSKSGIENNISVVSQVPEGVLWTIDLCQFRASRALINGLLGMNCSVMLTGSKFYQSPPFCAVLLVPKTVTDQFKHIAPEIVSQFSTIFSSFDIPIELSDIRENLPEFRNYGLLLRWEAALAEMEALARLDTYDVNEKIEEWNRSIIHTLESSPFFELMPNQEITNKTIVSFRVKTDLGDYLDHQQLLKMYHELCGPVIVGLDGYNKILFGQPVQYGEKSFIRLALGASDLREFVLHGYDSRNDMLLIGKLEEYVTLNH